MTSISQNAGAGGLLALASPLYRRFVAGYAFSSTASWMQRVCFAYLAWEMTHSTFWLGVISFAEFLPILLVSPLIGEAIDRRSKKTIILCFEVLPACAMLILLALLISGLLNLTLLLAIAFVVGTSMSISHPAQLAWYPTLLASRDHIGSAANIYILSLNIARFAGAGLVGLMISFSGIETAVALTALGYLIFVSVLATIPEIDRPAATTPAASALKGAIEGLRYLSMNPVLGIMLIIIAITSAGARGVPELAPALTEIRLERPAELFSLLVAFTGLGSVIAGVWNLAVGDHSVRTAIRQTVNHSLVLALTVLGLALNPSFWIAVLLFAVLGFAITITAVKSQQVIQSLVDDDKRGRINTLYFLTFRGGTAFGALWMGVTGSAIGLTLTLVLGALACAIAWAVGRQLRGEYAKLDAEQVQTP